MRSDSQAQQIEGIKDPPDQVSNQSDQDHNRIERLGRKRFTGSPEDVAQPVRSAKGFQHQHDEQADPGRQSDAWQHPSNSYVSAIYCGTPEQRQESAPRYTENHKWINPAEVSHH